MVTAIGVDEAAKLSCR